jgi:hypothetical protein
VKTKSKTILCERVTDIPPKFRSRQVFCLPGSPVYHVMTEGTVRPGTECGTSRADCSRGGMKAMYAVKCTRIRLCRKCVEVVA